MAQSPLGGFADLSSYRNLVNAQKLQQLQQGGALAQLLGNVEAGAQQGNTLANLGDIIQQQNQLRNDQALQSAYKTQLLNEALQNALDPNRQLANQVQAKLALASLNPESGFVSIPSNITEPILQPAAITQEQQAAINLGGLTPESLNLLKASTPITPVLNIGGVTTGFGYNPSIPAAAEKTNLQQAIDKATAIANVRSDIPKLYTIPDPNNPEKTINTYLRPSQAPEGAAAYVRPISTSSRSSGGLTPNQQNISLRKAGEAGLNPDDPKYFNSETGNYDFSSLAIDSGKALRANKLASDSAKSSGLTGKSKGDIEALNAAQLQLNTLQDEIANIAKSGKTPGFLDNIIAAETAAPPTGWLTAGWQQTLKGLQSEESKELEDKKSVISSSLTKAISGLAVSKQEASRLGFIPRAGDSFEELIRKAANVQEYINNQREGLGQGSSGSINPSTAVINPNSSAPFKIGRFELLPPE